MKKYDEFMEEIKPFLAGLTSPDYNVILETFWNRRYDEGGIPVKDIPVEKGIYSKIKILLEKKKILEATTSGNSRKMLVSLDFSGQKPSFGGEAARAEASNQGRKMILHAEEEPSIKETLFFVFGSSNWDDISNFLEDFLFEDFGRKRGLALFNDSAEAIQKRNLYLYAKGYGRLAWRPYNAQRFRIVRRLI